MQIPLLKEHDYSFRAREDRVNRALRPRKFSAYDGYLRDRRAADPLWIPEKVLLRENVERAYAGE